MQKNLKLSQEDLEDIKYLNTYTYDKAYLQLLADLNVLDDLEDWRLYQEMTRKQYENLDEDTEKYLLPFFKQ